MPYTPERKVIRSLVAALTALTPTHRPIGCWCSRARTEGSPHEPACLTARRVIAEAQEVIAELPRGRS